jgi:hypothetical protein
VFYGYPLPSSRLGSPLSSAATDPKIYAEHYYVAVCREYHTGRLQELPHITICNPMVPLPLVAYFTTTRSSKQGRVFYTPPSQGLATHISYDAYRIYHHHIYILYIYIYIYIHIHGVSGLFIFLCFFCVFLVFFWCFFCFYDVFVMFL